MKKLKWWFFTYSILHSPLQPIYIQFLLESFNHEVMLMELDGNQAHCSQKYLDTVMVEDYVALYKGVPVIVSN